MAAVGVEAPRRRRYILTTSDGDYRTRVLVIATGVNEPYVLRSRAEEVPHYAQVKPLDAYRDKRVFIVGKRNSALSSRMASIPLARQIILASPSQRVRRSYTHSIAGVRSLHPALRDHLLRGESGAGTIHRQIALCWPRLPHHVRPSTGGEGMELEADEVIAATGFRAGSAISPPSACTP